jgi:CheY-like chemotaxis protein
LPLVVMSPIGRSSADTPAGLFAAPLTKPVKQVQLYEALRKGVQMRIRCTRQPVALQSNPDAGCCKAGIRILLAEDNPTNQRVALMLLKRLGYRPDAVADGTEVLAMLRQARYDVLLLDIRMPEMNGIEAMQHIVSEWRPEQRPYVIALTADVTEETRQACLELGMAEFVPKPVMEKPLARALDNYMDWASSADDRPPEAASRNRYRSGTEAPVES